MIIRDATETDAEAIAGIYAHHVLNGTASYDLEPPPAEYHREKILTVQQAGWPYIVAEMDGQVAAYAYATQMRPRAAYRFTAEDSIYVHPDHSGAGSAGRCSRRCWNAAPMRVRDDDCSHRRGGAGIDRASRALGFRQVGRLKGVGFKFGQWLDRVYMQRDLPAAPGA